MSDGRIATPRPPGGELAALARQDIDPSQLVYIGFLYELDHVGRVELEPRPADYEKYGPEHRMHYQHGYHDVLPPMALIALFAPMARSTNRSTAKDRPPPVLLLCVTSSRTLNPRPCARMANSASRHDAVCPVTGRERSRAG
jgi:hypothetical protein